MLDVHPKKTKKNKKKLCVLELCALCLPYVCITVSVISVCKITSKQIIGVIYWADTDMSCYSGYRIETAVCQMSDDNTVTVLQPRLQDIASNLYSP